MNCEWCSTPLPAPTNGSRGRRFCSDACRKRASRAGPDLPPPTSDDGPVTAAVRTALDDLPTSGTVDGARAQMALSLAGMVDAGSVAAAHELRGVLSELSVIEDEDTAEFWRAVQTPTRPDAA